MLMPLRSSVAVLVALLPTVTTPLPRAEALPILSVPALTAVVPV